MRPLRDYEKNFGVITSLTKSRPHDRTRPHTTAQSERPHAFSMVHGFNAVLLIN